MALTTHVVRFGDEGQGWQIGTNGYGIRGGVTLFGIRVLNQQKEGYRRAFVTELEVVGDTNVLLVIDSATHFLCRDR